jgi:catechol 2,3-dioxygenase-like lactoylglutathione lyase family enzyme
LPRKTTERSARLAEGYLGLKWIFARHDELGVGPERIGVSGTSAGAGLAAGLALLARDRGEVPLQFQPQVTAALSAQEVGIGRKWESAGILESTPEGDVMDVQFITSVAVIAPDPGVSRRLYVDALGLALTGEGDGYLHSEAIAGCKSFGVWPLAQAAQACFGTPDWPVERTVPQASIEFEVAEAETVQVAAEELKEKGFTLLHDARTEPWGQTVARLQSSEGAIIGISYAPALH